METKQEVIEKLKNKIDNRKDMIRHEISYLISSLTEIESSLDVISYLSYLKDDLIQNDGV